MEAIAIMDEGHWPRHVRVRVLGVRGTMCCPARVADTDRSRNRSVVQHGLQVAKFSGSASSVQFAFMQCGDTGTVIAPIFEAPQRFHGAFGGDPFLAQDPNDSTH